MMNLKKKCVSVMLSAACLLSMAELRNRKSHKNVLKPTSQTKAKISL